MISIPFLFTPTLTTVTRNGLKNLPTTTTLQLLGISYVNCEIFEYYALAIQKKRTRKTELTLCCEWKPRILQWKHISKMDNLQNLFIQLSKSWQNYTSKSDSGLLRFYSLHAKRCHRSTPYLLSPTSMTSEGEHKVFEVTDGNSLQVRIWIVANLIAVILKPITA